MKHLFEHTTTRIISGSSFTLLLVFLLFSCSKEYVVRENPQEEIMVIPGGFPEMDFPEDNGFTPARWELGKKLFYEKRLSRDGSLSCASCHKQSLAFADDVAFSPGVDQAPGTRNAPTLANIGYHPYMLREGGVPTIEMQVLVPIQEANEFDHNIVDIVEELKSDEDYKQMSMEAYNRSFDPFVLTRALATFERSLISGNSAYDQWVNGDEGALSPPQIRGMNLFFSEKAKCSECHGGFNFTSYAFENNGLDSVYSDPGRFRFTGKEEDRATFKTPTLRNVGLTAPYMHDGRFSSLEEVIDHYNSGGMNHPNKNESIQPLNLTNQEKKDLADFLKSLTDYEFINKDIYKE